MAEARLVAKIETKGAKKSTDELNDFAKSSENAEESQLDLGKATKTAGKAITASTAIFIAGAAALTKIATNSATAERELAALAGVARVSTEEFKALAFAAEQYNISGEKLSDISKDVNEKLGEFIATGGGGFKDFFEQVAPLVNLTAQELQGLSGPQVLQRVKNALDDANVALEQQSFFLESIASDTTLLIPLLAQEGAELERLTERYNQVNQALALTSEEQQGLNELAQTFNLVSEQGSNAATAIAATLAPTLNEFFNSVISVVPSATQALIDFFNTFIATENLSNIAAAEDRLAGINEEIAKLEGKDLGRGRSDNSARIRLANLREEAEAAEAQIKKLREEQQRLEDAQTIAGGTISGGAGGLPGKDPDTQREKELLDRRAELAREFREKEEQAELDFINRQGELQDQRAAQIIESQRLILSSSATLFDDLAGLAETFKGKQSNTYKALFAVSKAFSIAESIIAIQTGIAKAQELGFPANLAAISSVVSSTAGVISTINSTQFQARQQGGQISANRPFLVGEAGPELVQFNSGGRIASNQETRSLLGGSDSNITIINQTQGRIDSVEKQDDGQNVTLIVRQELDRQVLDPNSRFNKNLDKTRRVARSF